MKSVKLFAAFLLATTTVGVALAAESTTKPPTAQETAAGQAAMQDVGKLSKDGAKVFRNLHDARLAIFNAEPKNAKSFIEKAQTAIEQAKQDDDAYRKAEAEFDTQLNAAATKTGDAAKNATEDPTKAVAWLPIDGQLMLGEDFVATPEKAAAVQKANESVKKGDRQDAIETLKLADVDVNFTMAVLPLDKTAADIEQAGKLIDDGKFYEANALLKGTEERMRFDVVNLTGKPVPAADAEAAKSTSDTATTSDTAASKTTTTPAQ